MIWTELLGLGETLGVGVGVEIKLAEGVGVEIGLGFEKFRGITFAAKTAARIIKVIVIIGGCKLFTKILVIISLIWYISFK